MARVIVFDVNETLLDLAALDPAFARIFGDAAARREWFTQVLQSALTATVTAAYSDFGAVGMAALAMTAARRGIALTDADRQAIREGMQRLPAHPEVRESLERLRAGGLRLAALTNSCPGREVRPSSQADILCRRFSSRRAVAAARDCGYTLLRPRAAVHGGVSRLCRSVCCTA